MEVARLSKEQKATIKSTEMVGRSEQRSSFRFLPGDHLWAARPVNYMGKSAAKSVNPKSCNGGRYQVLCRSNAI